MRVPLSMPVEFHALRKSPEVGSDLLLTAFCPLLPERNQVINCTEPAGLFHVLDVRFRVPSFAIEVRGYFDPAEPAA
ncbi:hypothetical protein [Zavarzinia sp. CC-PAN008]|uniref:hypothetical protein n=1 Tax=Zavarzinia sp. CC-PAN008 TaxID=3243332 RepID=UPI003F744145